MSEVNQNLVERYQELLLKEPSSRIFAPLAEAYRKMGLLNEALDTCTQGLKLHPNFAGGHVAHAKIQLDLKNPQGAVEALQKAIRSSSDNLLAHLLYADTLLKLKKPKEALKSYKMVLFLNPTHDKAAKAVRQLESLTADEYPEEGFQLSKLGSTSLEKPTPIEPLSEPKNGNNSPILERILSLTDAFLVRNDAEKAMATLLDAVSSYGEHPEFVRRLRILRAKNTEIDEVPPVEFKRPIRVSERIDFLRSLKERIEHRRRSTSP